MTLIEVNQCLIGYYFVFHAERHQHLADQRSIDSAIDVSLDTLLCNLPFLMHVTKFSRREQALDFGMSTVLHDSIQFLSLLITRLQ